MNTTTLPAPTGDAVTPVLVGADWYTNEGWNVRVTAVTDTFVSFVTTGRRYVTENAPEVGDGGGCYLSSFPLLFRPRDAHPLPEILEATAMLAGEAAWTS